MRNKVLVLVAVMLSPAYCYVTGYHVEPVKATWSGLTRYLEPNNFVSQGVTCNFDSLSYVELFAGDSGSTRSGYRVGVWEGNTELTYATGVQRQPSSWVRFDNWSDAVVFTKGKRYVFKFTRSGSDSIQFYYDSTNKYKYGCLVAEPYAYSSADLACRVMGRMNQIDSLDFGAAEMSWWTQETNYRFDPWELAYWTRSASVKTVRLDIDWHEIQYAGPDSWCFDNLDASLRSLDSAAGCRIVGLLTQVPDWASTRRICVSNTYDTVWSIRCPPRHLEKPVDSASNYLAAFLRGVIAHCESRHFEIHDWEVLNEVNSEETIPGTGLACLSWWMHPNIYYAGDSVEGVDVSPGIHDMCSLYVRYAAVVESAIHAIDEHDSDRIAVNSLNHLNAAYHDDTLGPIYSGKEWLDSFYHVVDECDLPHFWDAISAHPYQEDGSAPFDPGLFEASAETLRTIMREHGDFGELWNTEFSLPGVVWWGSPPSHETLKTPEQEADICCQTFTMAEGMKGLTGGGFDRNYWWHLRAASLDGLQLEALWGLHDDDPNVPLWGFKQTAEQLTGKRLNGRILPVFAGSSAQVRMYEFEDPTSLKKTWVSWISGSDSAVVDVKLPARSDTCEATNLDYGDGPQPSPASAAVSGWLWRGITTRPKFITESTAVSRPELVAESLWISPLSSRVGPFETIHVKIRNRDSERRTPSGCTTWVRLTWNDSIVDSMCRADTIGPSQTVVLSSVWELPVWFHGDGLLAANVNPGMRYVEREGTDDNQAYQRLVIGSVIGGALEVTGPPGGKTDAPLLVCGLSSMSYEKDSTGQIPSDSARVLFAWYGAHGDSVVHETDTTAWFPFCADTAFVFPRGCGVYRAAVQYRDSGANDSPVYGDSTDSIVVFDSVPPAGSIIIEGGGRFASNSMRTLRLAASDSASGVYNMRFMNRGRVNLAQNGPFDPAGGCWGFTGTGCGYDSSLQMGKLTVGPSQAGVRQFVPAESISAYSGDSCVLEASILAHMHDGDATGDVSFWFYHIRIDSLNLHDTLWALVDSACYSGDLLSLTGRYSLSTQFMLSTPTPESGWVWRGGMVRVRAQGVDGGTGTVWCDNVGMNAYEPQAAGYAWYGPFETLTVWDIGSGAGQHVVGMCLMDSAGAENAVPYTDTVILDATPPVVDMSLPMIGQLVNGLVEIVGVAYDSVEVEGDTFFESRRLFFKSSDSTNWLPVEPDSFSTQVAWPDSMASQGPAVHLGYWNTLGLDDGTYYLLLTASDSAGNTSSCTTWVMVDQGFGGGGMCGGPEGGGTGMGEGSCYVGSAEGHVLHLSDDLTVLDTFSVSDSGSQAYVTSILEVGNDSLLVLDAANKRIHKLHRGGQHRRRLVSGLSQPVDLKRDSSGNFWLVDRGWNRIGKFRSNGTLVFVRGGLGADSLHFHSPEGIAVKGGLVYVADAGNNRIALWDTSGHFKTTITGDFENPTAVYVSDAGAIYLTDGTDGKLKGITPLGGNIVSIGTTDSSKLKGLVPSQNRHNLFSLASESNKVYKLRIQSDESRPGGAQSGGRVNLPKTLALNQPFPNPARTRLNIAYALPRQTRVVLKLYDVAGKLVTTLANGEQKPGYYNLTWNRQDTKGRSCACGIYFCTLAAENQRFSRKVILTE